MPKPDDDILLKTLVRVAKEQKNLDAARGFLQVLSEASFEAQDRTPLVAAYHEIKNYFNNCKQKPLVNVDIQNNSGTINTMEGCTVTNRLPNYYTNVNNDSPQLRTGQSY